MNTNKNVMDHLKSDLVKEIIETEMGLAIIQQILAWSFRAFPMLKSDARAQALADECAIDSIAIMGNTLNNELMEAMMPVLAQVMELPPPTQVRVDTSVASASSEPESEEPEVEEEIKPRKPPVKRTVAA